MRGLDDLPSAGAMRSAFMRWRAGRPLKTLIAALGAASAIPFLLAAASSAAHAQGAVLAPPPGPLAAAFVPSKILPPSPATWASLNKAAMPASTPVERQLAAPPVEAFRTKPASVSLLASPSVSKGTTGAPTNMVSGRVQPAPVLKTPGVSGTGGATSSSTKASPEANDAIGPQNFGVNRHNTIYHYTDSLVNPGLFRSYPYRPTGWFVFVSSNGFISRCSASLIGRSILVTAGHCVHDGGNRASGFIRSGTFYASYQNGQHLGVATANTVYTTSGWYNEGFLDEGYDIGIVVLNKRNDLPNWYAPQEIGTSVGWYSFCSSNCLQQYWHLSQIGYPANYYSGDYQTQGEHLEASDTRDFVYGSGMRGGSSGGPHIANLGSMNDSSLDNGQWPHRNVVFAVTSWGYVGEDYKLQGASPLSGPTNKNNFKKIWNTACTRARALHGTATCYLFP